MRADWSVCSLESKDVMFSWFAGASAAGIDPGNGVAALLSVAWQGPAVGDRLTSGAGEGPGRVIQIKRTGESEQNRAGQGMQVATGHRQQNGKPLNHTNAAIITAVANSAATRES